MYCNRNNILFLLSDSPTQTGIDGNKHKFGKKNENTDETGSKMPDHCSALVETLNQVINQKNQLEEQVRQLYHRRDCLKMLLKGEKTTKHINQKHEIELSIGLFNSILLLFLLLV